MTVVTSSILFDLSYLNILFRSFEITLCGRPSNALTLDHCAFIVVSMMGGENKVQGYITQLFEAVESYVHPSNVGP